uniref:C-type lectin domain-containing protein n=1 Tax=Pygocentrus nattereri TaxID=42514 RepID=A0AAR2LEX7_PYGNA
LSLSLSFSLSLCLSISLSLWWGECEAGWRPYQDRCYFFSSSTKTWHDALTECQTYCVAQGGHLVSVHNEETVSFLTVKSIRQVSGDSITTGVSLWMGGHDSVTEGDYSWSDGSSLSHSNWGPGEPNDHSGRENCVEMGRGEKQRSEKKVSQREVIPHDVI